MDLNVAIENGLFYILEASVRALQPPVRTLRLFMNAGDLYIWQVAVKSRKDLLLAGFTDEEIDAVVQELKVRGLRLRMRLFKPLTIALLMGKHPDTSTPEFANYAIPLLMEYCRRPEVSERTREIVLIARDTCKAAIEKHRRGNATRINYPFVDQDGLGSYHSPGILPP